MHYITSGQLDTFSQIEGACVSCTQINKQSNTNTLDSAPLDHYPSAGSYVPEFALSLVVRYVPISPNAVSVDYFPLF